jgi:hypothetical protein
MGLVRGLRVSPCEALRKDGAAHVRTSHRPGPAAATSRAVHRSISHLRHTPLPRRSRCALQVRERAYELCACIPRHGARQAVQQAVRPILLKGSLRVLASAALRGSKGGDVCAWSQSLQRWAWERTGLARETMHPNPILHGG